MSHQSTMGLKESLFQMALPSLIFSGVFSAFGAIYLGLRVRIARRLLQTNPEPADGAKAFFRQRIRHHSGKAQHLAFFSGFCSLISLYGTATVAENFEDRTLFDSTFLFLIFGMNLYMMDYAIKLFDAGSRSTPGLAP